MIFRTADFSREFVQTGDPTAEEELATGGYFTQQWVGAKRMLRDIFSTTPRGAG